MTAQSVVTALKAKRSGSGWVAKCPAHDDHDPSLSISEEGGTVLVHCHAGCSQKAVIDGLRNLGVWEPHDTGSSKPVAEYDYTDEHRVVLYQVLRYDPKSFKQRSSNGHGGWIWKKGKRQVLFHLPEVLTASVVFVVEGERDVETLKSHGFVATTHAGGALGRTGDIAAMLDHIDYVAKKFGVEHVAIGTDVAYTSSNAAAENRKIPRRARKRVRWEALWPLGALGGATAEQVQSMAWTNWPLFTVGLAQRGYSDADIRKVLGENVLRVCRANFDGVA